MARIMVATLLVLVCVLVVLRSHAADGKQAGMKTIASIVVHAHHGHANLR
jgi:hypothetical protein